MRFLAADYIYPISSAPVKQGVVVVDDTGRILEILPPGVRDDVEYHPGILVPGFINAHAHLELSHLKGQITEGQGMAGFISELVPARNQSRSDFIRESIRLADEEMHRNGIVACGDISNTSDSFEVKRNSRVCYHTFLEVFDLRESETENCIRTAVELQQQLGSGASSIVPHAPYTCTPNLFRMLQSRPETVISIHSQESEAENTLFESGTGLLAEMMHKFGVNLSGLRSGKSSLQTVFPLLNKKASILLVHNTFTRPEDVEWLLQRKQKVYFCLCPNANLYIEGRLPDVLLLVRSGIPVVLGTDSYASNHQLSLLAEMQTLAARCPELTLDPMLEWVTLNGARALGMEKELGSLEPGKTPGINLLAGWDSPALGKATVTRLV